MIAENIYTIAMHLPEEELERLYIMLGKKAKQFPKKKRSKKYSITKDEALQYLLATVFKSKK